MKRLDKASRTVLLAMVLAVVAGVSWFRGVRWLQAVVQGHRAAIQDLSRRIHETEAMVIPSGGLGEWLALHGQELRRLQARFPNEEELPRLLNALARQMQTDDFELGTISPGNLEPVRDAQGRDVLIDGVPCVRLPVTIQGRGRYHAMLGLLEQVLSETFPAVAALESMDLRAVSPDRPVLDVTLRLKLYLVRESSAADAT